MVRRQLPIYALCARKVPFLVMALLFSMVTPAFAKTTVCSITINSDDEIEAFKKNLDPKNTEFIELTTLPGVERSWGSEKDKPSFLKVACEKKIRCDVLVISGHFGGGFFGRSGMSLPLSDLERLACDADCDGITQTPREVFLMGCNTLASKEADRRTPLEYRNVLVADGFSPERAEDIAALRYSPLGDAYGDRMRRVFRGASRIYGFNSIGPLGRTAGPFLSSYLGAGGKVRYEERNLSRIDSSPNSALQNFFRSTSFTQVSGSSDVDRRLLPVCYLENSGIALSQKLSWITQRLSDEKGALLSINVIGDFLGSLDQKKFTDKEWEILEPVMHNVALKKRLWDLARANTMVSVQSRIFDLMNVFGWISPAGYEKLLAELVLTDIDKPFRTERKDTLCSLSSSRKLSLQIPYEKIPEERWQDSNFIDVLGCVAKYDERIYRRLWLLATSSQTVLRDRADRALGRMPMPRPQAEWLFEEIMRYPGPWTYAIGSIAANMGESGGKYAVDTRRLLDGRDRVFEMNLPQFAQPSAEILSILLSRLLQKREDFYDWKLSHIENALGVFADGPINRDHYDRAIQLLSYREGGREEKLDKRLAKIVANFLVRNPAEMQALAPELGRWIHSQAELLGRSAKSEVLVDIISSLGEGKKPVCQTLAKLGKDSLGWKIRDLVEVCLPEFLAEGYTQTIFKHALNSKDSHGGRFIVEWIKTSELVNMKPQNFAEFALIEYERRRRKLDALTLSEEQRMQFGQEATKDFETGTLLEKQRAFEYWEYLGLRASNATLESVYRTLAGGGYLYGRLGDFDTQIFKKLYALDPNRMVNLVRDLLKPGGLSNADQVAGIYRVINHTAASFTPQEALSVLREYLKRPRPEIQRQLLIENYRIPELLLADKQTPAWLRANIQKANPYLRPAKL